MMRSRLQMTTPMMFDSTKLRQRASLCTQAALDAVQAQQHAHGGGELERLDGLGEIDLGAAFEADDLVVLA